jgi:methylglutaconyl-CoA hydratase
VTESTVLLTSLDGGVLSLTLNRPEKRNALDAATIAALTAALDRADLDAAVRVVTLRGAGKDFCAGADLAELLASVDHSMEENERSARALGDIFLKIRQLPKPVIAIVHGRALAGGAGLATACDMVLASESAWFGFPEIQRGFVPAMVLTILRRLVGERVAFDLVATGRLLTAVEAAAHGLISRVAPDAELDQRADALLSQLAASSSSALGLIKRLVDELDDKDFAEGIALGARANALARAHDDFRSAVRAFLR